MYANKHIIAVLGKIRLARLTPTDVQKLLAARLASGLKPRSAQQIHAILRRALGQAYRQGLVARNVASSQLVDAPLGPYQEISPLNERAALTLMQASRGHRYEHLYALLSTTGLRVGEALALRWQDVDLEQGWLSVNGTLQRAPGQHWQRTERKSKSGVRKVKLVAQATAALRTQRKRNADQQLSVFGPDFVFATCTGQPCDATNVYHELRKLLAKAGLPAARVHDLRHGAATYLLAAGVPPRTVMAINGLVPDLDADSLPARPRPHADRRRPATRGAPRHVSARGRHDWLNPGCYPRCYPDHKFRVPSRTSDGILISKLGAPRRARTVNLRIKSPLLCH